MAARALGGQGCLAPPARDLAGVGEDLVGDGGDGRRDRHTPDLLLVQAGRTSRCQHGSQVELEVACVIRNRIPNLIEIQRDSYNRFLQMDMLPEERENTGLQAVFRSVFPISDFRGTATLDFVEFQIGNWQCKCGRLEGLNYLRANCKNCGSTIKVDPLVPGETLCHNCGTFNAVPLTENQRRRLAE